MSTDANALHKEPFAVSVRRFVLFLIELCVIYFFIWVPWRTNRASFLLFFGSGMTQVAATYAQEWNPGVTPPLFMNNFVRILVSLLALVLFVLELIAGFGTKPWWEALLLPIPPFIIASVWYKSRNPTLPLFTGAIALVIALMLKILT